MPEMVTLDKYVVVRTTPLAIGVAKKPVDLTKQLIWIPRSVCDTGESLEPDDEDIVVAEWYAERESLDY